MDNQVTQEHLAALSRSAMAFARMNPGDDLYREIAGQVQSLLGDAVVAVCSFDAATQRIEQRALVGLPKTLADAAGRMNVQTSPMLTTANAEAVEQMTSGRLVRMEEGVYELCLRKVPRAVTRSFEKIAGVHSVYGMGCVAEEECFGGVTFCLRRNAVLPQPDVLEALIFQAATALKRWQAETDLRKSEERYRLLMERAADPYAVADLNARFLEVNEAACMALGYSREEFLQLTALDILDPAELADHPFPWKQIRNRENFVQTRRVRCKDSLYVTFEIHTVPLPDEQVLFCARDVTKRRELERAVIEAGEHERRAVGRDLHDSLGQQLTAIGYLSKALERDLESDQNPKARQAERIAQLVRDAVVQTRRMAHGLCPVDMSQEGLAVSLDQLAAQLRTAHDLQCMVTVDGPVDEITPDVTLHLYQITQEATTNAIRHGQADEIAITLSVQEGRGELSIRDNGSGLPAGAESGAGLGLRAMHYRADLIDGSLEVMSSDAGTSITCSFALR